MGEFLKKNVARGSTLVTDGGTEFMADATTHLKHKPEMTGQDWERARARMARLNLFVANFKMWMRGTYHQSPHERLLQYYLDEFCFRHNRRKSASPLKPLQRLLELASRLRAPVWRELHSADFRPT